MDIHAYRRAESVSLTLFLSETQEAWQAFRRDLNLTAWEAARIPAWARHEERITAPWRDYVTGIGQTQNETIGA